MAFSEKQRRMRDATATGKGLKSATLNQSKTGLISLIKSEYKVPSPPLYESDKVTRRVLTPCHEYQFFYSSEFKDKDRQLQQARRKCLVEPHSDYRQAGVTAGRVPYIEPNPRHIVIEHLKSGLSKQSMGKIYRQMRNRGDQMSLDIDMLRDKAGPIYEYLSQLRKQVRQSRVSAADCKLNKKVSLRLASSALQDGVKEMYSALHESEHRLLHVRAKGDCESHISACNERQQLEKSLKVPRHDKSDMTAKKPVWLDDEYMNNAVRSKLPMFSRIKEAAWHTARLNALKNEKKAFFKKICCIISVLGYIKQMKQPTANPTPLSPETMKKYKHTIDILTSDVLHHARLTDGLVSKRPTISKSFTTQRRPTVFKKPATSVLRETVAARRSTLQLNKDDLASNLTANSLRSPGKHSVMRKSLHPSPVHVYQSLEEGIFDPATITWSDFLKVGTKKEGTKLKGDNLPDSLTTVYARLAWKDKKHSLRPGKGGLRQNIWKTLKKSFAKRTSHPKSGSRVGSLQKWNLDPDPNVKLFVLDKINPIEHSQLNWLKITLRSNKYLSHILSHRHRESKMRYRHMRATLGLNETAKWRHQFEKDFKKLKLVNVADEEDLYIECVGFLEKEAESLKLQDKVVIGELLKKIQSICQEPSLKHITIYKGQVKIQQLVMSLPAYDLCEQHMQAALQFVLVNVMHGEPDLIVPMMKQRGLPLHPTIREQGRVSHQKLFPHKKFVRRISHDFVEVNKRLSSLPSAKAGYGKTVISQLQSNVLYNYS